ncbi:MAG: MATE family efflux transporter [Theionarchaea archaeon]|nr:MATE family efflux transporter [Theionarchaea archaeon]
MEKIDFTEMDISQAIRYIAFPSILGMLFRTMYNLVDMFWIGRLGYEQLAAIGIFGIFFEFAIVFNEVVGVGSVALIARHYGAKNYQRVNEVVKQTLLLKLMIALVFCFTGFFFIKYILIGLGGQGDVITYGIAYGQIMSVGFIFLLSSATLFTAMRGVGDARTPMKLMIISNIMNIILDPLFIFTFGWGISGAAIASVLSQMLTFIVGILLLTTGRHVVEITPRVEIDIQTMKNILFIGIPSGVEMLIRNITNMITIRIISGFGMTVLAGFQIFLRIIGMAWMPLFGLTLACGTLVGHNLGAKKPEQAEKTALHSGYLGALCMLLVGAIMGFFPHTIVTVFNSTPEVVQAGVTAFQTIAPFLVFFGFSFPLSGAFFGSGDTKPPMIITLISMFFYQVPLMILLSGRYGIQGVFTAWGTALVVTCVLSVTWFFRGRWKLKKVE